MTQSTDASPADAGVQSADRGAADGQASSSSHGRAHFWKLTLGSIGVVYGDIGTSPLYAFREAVNAASGEAIATPTVVLGVLSMIVWSLIIVVTLKYITILLRADNNGEGGTLSLTALAFRALGKRTFLVLILGIVGAAMFYGSSLITPALSVMSAIEGLKTRTPAFEPFVLPLTVLILVCLFAVQSHGTGRVAALFGPITAVWFVVIAFLGALHIADYPGVLHALNPLYAATFLATNGWIGLTTLGAVFLVVTGSEALYADLGHFGRKPIQTAWIFLVLPALLINYFGQGALVLSQPTAIEDPFYRLVPDSMLVPMVILATAATVIASQAVITGAYSITQQAIQLGLLPRFAIRHTSALHYGQIYMPRVNTALLVGVLLLVFMFRTSSALAHAYVLAVAATGLSATLLGVIVIWRLWGWRLWAVILLMAPFILVDSAFLFATLLKLVEGAWVPVLFGGVIILVMFTWRRGTRILANKTHRTEVPLESLLRNLERKPPHRVPGTAVFLTSDPGSAPTALMHNLKHNKILHEHNVILTIVTADTPRVPEEDRVVMTPVSPHFSTVTLKFGFMEQPNVPKALAIARKQGWSFDIMSTSFFLSRRALKPSPQSGMPLWQDRLFIGLAKSANDATDFFQIPTGRVVEVGTQVTL
ncbi:potassium transporter Kup [Pseudorhodoplanes sinuspersici]|uniref:Probable potassium transport system protein Kup n=1 Tax=Pseudorhodoplanes sinuspersici TaxID=1235591 RepID=A0A1W6ZVH8_9HYPH|nr:potassium transporter Kup [Pseudorhodoplanes sinuspersici]ARQ01141.1 potassium transporter Kup [Pseudorhodoplanes sinuspersici]RKE72791.1 KUP system potassium uptake protein [Pseudorhodoplanes sinuspersici]